jgi:hypothetical protein
MALRVDSNSDRGVLGRDDPNTPSATSATSAGSKQLGAKVAQIDIARRLARAIWHMLSRNQQFAPRGPTFRLAA